MASIDWLWFSWGGVTIMALSSWFSAPNSQQLTTITKSTPTQIKIKHDSSQAACIRKFREVAHNIGAQPEELLTLSLFETGGTLSPTKRGPNVKGRGRAIGMIQIMPATARELGTTTKALKTMTCPQQLEIAQKYFKKRGYRGGGLQQLYSTVFCGNPHCKTSVSDGYHTLASAIRRMNREHRPRAKKLLKKYP